MADRPTGRQKHIVEGGSGVHREGSGLGTGPVGSGSNFHGGNQSSNSSGGGRETSRAGSRGGGISFGAIVLVIIIVLIFYWMGGGSDSEDTGYDESVQQTVEDVDVAESGTILTGGVDSWSGPSSSMSGWSEPGYEPSQLDTQVASGARDKRTTIRKDGTDQNVILVYLCGTDLESKSGMASGDLQEMAAAALNEKVRIYVYTGGCKKWHLSGISKDSNQIYEVTSGGIRLLEKDMGTGSMVDPETLTQFLNWARKNTSGNRYDLIFWDHGGGSVSGFGYDEKKPRAGSMTLADIDKALKNGQITFDFVGFDACLMATVETALVVGDYADYLIASEEIEPGIGWNYTPWLNALARDPGMATTEIGKMIADSFTEACAQLAGGQKTTLSVVDLAELACTVPDSLKAFATSTSALIEAQNYETVANARSGAREFAPSSQIDQVDLVHLCMNLGTEEAKTLARSIQGAVKYNKTSKNMTNSYGLSVYFPMRRSSSVDSMVETYEQIGMDADYTKVIEQAAAMNVYSQAGSGSQTSPYESLFGDGESSGFESVELITELLGSLLSSDYARSSGLTAGNTAFLGRSGITPEMAAKQLSLHHFPKEQLIWQTDASGSQVISLDDNAWRMTTDLALQMFYDDGEGYVDLGRDNVYEFDDNGNLTAPSDRTWLSVNGQTVAYYYLDETDGVITGRIPAFLNGDRVNLILVFDDAHPDGRIAGANYDYEAGDETILVSAKNLTVLNPGDTIQFLCDLYTYDGKYQDSYQLGKALAVPEEGMDALTVANMNVGDGAVRLLYRFTDTYGGNWWTTPLIR
ncbi:MAG: peptidase C11 [Lachnospiraceae bacterium]|nr:peptidase C11 [Lachnospiraceae bacterium]